MPQRAVNSVLNASKEKPLINFCKATTARRERGAGQAGYHGGTGRKREMEDKTRERERRREQLEGSEQKLEECSSLYPKITGQT